MNESGTRRLRILAGPNGSGKTTLYDYLTSKRYFKIYYHINADKITEELPIGLNLESYPIQFDERTLKNYLSESPFQQKTKESFTDLISVSGKTIRCRTEENLTYLSAALAEFIRQKMLESGSSFSFESVFSHPSKVDFMRKAKDAGYKIYLYFISTQDSKINLERVLSRASLGGHSVPANKIVDRYKRTMECLYEALLATDRAFLFDNSEDQNPHQMFMEMKDGEMIFNSETIPQWFIEYVQSKIQG